MARNRQDRINDFTQFYNNSVDLFTALRENDPRTEKLHNMYRFYVCPGSRGGTNNQRVVDVFFGHRPFESLLAGRIWSALPEQGATLLFSRDDGGYIHISLYPACTEDRKPFENFVTLYPRVDPKKLHRKTFIRRVWRNFIAYMECTSLDGDPTRWQRLRIAYLRKIKHLTVSDRFQPTKASVFGLEVLKWVFTVGLSGLLILFIGRYIPSPDAQTDQLKKMNINLEEISRQLNKLSSEKSQTPTHPKPKDSLTPNGKTIAPKGKNTD